jgi:hypothetical protein
MAEHLRVKQIKPLMFAVATHFDPEEADNAQRQQSFFQKPAALDVAARLF